MNCLPRVPARRVLQSLQAKHQGMNPTGSFKDTGMTAAASFAKPGRFPLGRLRLNGKYFCFHGGLRRAGGMRSLVLIPQGKITWGKSRQALRLRRGYLPIQD